MVDTIQLSQTKVIGINVGMAASSGCFILSRTKIPEDVFNENFENDWYLSAKEAIKYGVADKIITSLDEII